MHGIWLVEVYNHLSIDVRQASTNSVHHDTYLRSCKASQARLQHNAVLQHTVMACVVLLTLFHIPVSVFVNWHLLRIAC